MFVIYSQVSYIILYYLVNIHNKIYEIYITIYIHTNYFPSWIFLFIQLFNRLKKIPVKYITPVGYYIIYVNYIYYS